MHPTQKPTHQTHAHAIKNHTLSNKFLAFRSGQCASAASTAAFPVVISASSLLTHLVFLYTFQNTNRPPIDHDTHIRRHEILVIKTLSLARKSVEAIEQRDHSEEDEGEPGRVGLKGRFEDERVAGDVLSAECGVEADVSDADGDPG